MQSFFQSDNYLKGYFGKVLIKSLLETSGYSVCHYGYEEILLDALSKRTSLNSNSSTGRRIRKSPDLLVYDDKIMTLVEVKTRLTLPPTVESREITPLKQYWSDAVLVLIVPDGDIFYAQHINAIKNDCISSVSSLSNLQDIFTQISDETIIHYREISLKILKSLMSKTQRQKMTQNGRCFINYATLDNSKWR